MTTASQALEARLSAAKRLLQRDRHSFYESERRPPENTVDADAAEWLAEYDDAILAIESTAAELARLQAECEALRKDAEWRPIETAPQTGRTLLLGYCNAAGKWRTVRGQWMSQDYIDEYWEEPDDAKPGWFETVVESDDIPNCWPIDPTHWKPLPAPPAALSTSTAPSGSFASPPNSGEGGR